MQGEVVGDTEEGGRGRRRRARASAMAEAASAGLGHGGGEHELLRWRVSLAERIREACSSKRDKAEKEKR